MPAGGGPDPTPGFFEEADHHLSRLANPEKLLACRFLQAEQERTLYLTQPQLEQYEAARWRGLSWFGVTFGSPSVRLWDRPRPSFLLQEEPYLKNRLSSFCVRHDGTQRGSHGGGDRPLPTGVPSGSASALMSLASHMRQTGIRMKTPLKVVTITLGAANAAQRREMEAAFGCPVSQNLGERVGGSGGLHVSRRPPPCDG